MNIPLSKLPDNALKQILEKTKFQALCRLRKSHKRLDTVAEENRFSIRAVADDVDDLAEINTNGRQMTMISHIEFKIFFFISTQNFHLTIYRVTTRTGMNGRSYKLGIESLSGIYFKTACCEVREHDDTLSNNLGRPISIEDLKRLKFECDFLSLSGYSGDCDETNLEKVFSSIKFSKLQLSLSSISHRILLNPLIQNCTYVSIRHVFDFPEDVSTVLRHVQIRNIEPFSQFLNLPVFVNSVITELKKDRTAIGGIKNIRLYVFPATNFSSMSQYLIWNGKVASFIYKNFYRNGRDKLCKEKCSFYSVEVDGGTLLMIRNWDGFQISFIEGNSREIIVWKIINVLMRWTPCDLSSIWENLVNTSDLPSAIENMMKGFEADYLFQPTR